MSKQPRVFITRPIPDDALARLNAALDVDMWPTCETLAPTAERMPDLDGLLTYGHERITEAMMASAPRLRIISTYSVGYDHIDVEAARRHDIRVGNTPGVLSDATADMTFALLLSAARNVLPGARLVHERRWMFYDPNILWGQEVHHATIGIVGLGRIGLAVAKRALAFDMRVLYTRRERQREAEKDLGIEYRDLDRLLAESDYVTLHVPLTAETRHMIGARELALMKPSAYLVNIARGGVLDQDALYEALVAGKIAGAALDVTEPEPIDPSHPLLALDNTLIVPHLGTATTQTRSKMAHMACDNLLAGLSGDPLPYPVA